jgi:hypothetical protein
MKYKKAQRLIEDEGWKLVESARARDGEES